MNYSKYKMNFSVLMFILRNFEMILGYVKKMLSIYENKGFLQKFLTERKFPLNNDYFKF